MRKTNSTFLEGPILPSLLRFALPVLLALFLQALYGAVDLWAVGTFCDSSDVSAVATGSQTMLIVTGIITGLSMGIAILLGHRFGEKDYKRAANVIGTSIWIFALLGMILTLVMVIAAPAIAVLMHAPAEAFDKTVHYIRICGAGTLFIVGYNVMSNIFRGMGNSKAPLLFVTITCIVNIIGDIVLISVFNMGTAGAALATIAAQAVSVVLSVALVRRNGLPLPFTKENMRFDKATAKNIVKLSSPIALQDMCNEISYLILIGLVNTLGVISSAGVGIAERLVMFILLIPMSYMSSISAFVAQNIGAGQKERAKKSMWLGMATAVGLGGIMSYMSFFHGDMLSSIFIKDFAVIQASVQFLKATAIECFILSIAYCFTGYYNGLGKTSFVMAQGLCAIFLVRIPYAYYASRKPAPSLFEIGMSATLAAAFTLLICIVYYIHQCKREKQFEELIQ
ncbi:MATE family efflux transporter [Clostridium sp. D2Q-14]|uniref:MATE family efflux transporter n=1 Tax=Anaeromonas gelatinilytica TaxID=2683194 RepID=UPI00193B502E|nr:MATE family efflux transporter [Anaeromonas gelatinilytica]MBS4534596.1 MATE family efflux transporter [Anaeromonas gelatinilytica]